MEEEPVSEEPAPGVAEVEAAYAQERVDAQARVTARSDPAAFLNDLDKIATFVEKLRASGVKHFAHPSGLTFTFETAAARPANW